jgi:hypothetical protein
LKLKSTFCAKIFVSQRESSMSINRFDPMESWGKVRVDALELQDPYHRTDPAPLTEARQIAKMKALMTINRKLTTGGASDGNSAFMQFKEVERILNEADMCDRAQEFLLAKELCAASSRRASASRLTRGAGTGRRCPCCSSAANALRASAASRSSWSLTRARRCGWQTLR